MKKILGILIALMISTKAFASIAIMPTKVELNTNKNKSNYISTSIEVKGDNKQSIRFKAYTGYFKINEKGEIVQLENQTAPNDISKKLKFVPSEFNVLPGRSQKVRINIVGVNSLPDGENRCLLYIEDVKPQTQMLNLGASGYGAQIIVKSRVGIPIYLDKGNFTKQLKIENFSVVNEHGQNSINVKLNSTGNSKVRFTSVAQIADGRKLVKEIRTTSGVVPDNCSRTIKEKLDTSGIDAGDYTLRYVLTYTDEKGKRQNIKEETQIQIKGEM